MKIANGHQVVMPYLILKRATDFIAFAKKVFHAQQTLIKLREDDNTIMHAEIQIGGSTVMLGEASDQWEPQNAGLFVYVDNADATYAIALQHGATSIMEPADQNYGRACGVTDPFGNVWWITSLQ